MRLWVTGYRAYELSVFNDKDPKKLVIKHVIKEDLKNRCENGLEWVLTGGQLGVEQWTIETVLELKSDYPELKIALMLPFANFGENWQEDKQQHLMELKQAADFCGEVSRQPYSSPQQLKNYQTFMLSHTEGATLIYDPDYPGKSKYDHQSILKRQAKTTYGEELIDMFELQDAATEMAEQSANDQE